ncbi:LytTR family transcriptional regulator DNA-binding domain-containing protein [Enterococcus lactis]
MVVVNFILQKRLPFLYGFFHLHKIFYTLHKRQTMLHHVSGMSKVFYMNTDQILEQLDACFTQIHTSFIININFVRQASRTKVILNNHRGIELPISRKYRENVSNKFIHLQK